MVPGTEGLHNVFADLELIYQTSTIGRIMKEMNDQS